MTETSIDWYATPRPGAPTAGPAYTSHLGELAGRHRCAQVGAPRTVRTIAFVTSFTVVGGALLGVGAIVVRAIRRALLRIAERKGGAALVGILTGVTALLLAEALAAR